MSVINKNKVSNFPHIANLLSSLLLCYPEIAAINLEPRANVVKFSFYIDNVAKKKLFSFKKKIEQSLLAYYNLEKKEVEVCSFSFQPLDVFSIIEFKRDLWNISLKEIALVIALMREEFGSSLVTEKDDELVMDDLSLHEELIDYILENAKKTSTNIKLVALRDEGRVLVYNK